MQEKKFSYYDVEQFLREAGAERINEDAIRSFAEELNDYMKEVVEEAEVYANHAGRTRVVTNSDIEMAASCKSKKVYATIPKAKNRVVRIKARPAFQRPVLDIADMLVDPAIHTQQASER